MALAMIEEAEKRGDLRPGMRVIEYTGGSTGSSVAMVCAVKGYLFEALSSNAFAEAEPETFYTDQLNNRDSVLGYRKIDGKISAFCGAVGTAGMLMGVSRALREAGGVRGLTRWNPPNLR
jgi:cysteine synthase A